MPSLPDFDIASLADLFASWGHSRANAGRFLRHFYNSGGQSIDAARLGPALMAKLQAHATARSTQIVARREAGDGTVKLLVGVGEDVKSQMSKGKSWKYDERSTEDEKKERELFSSAADYPLPTADSASAYRLLPTAYSSSTVECVLMPSHIPDRAAGCVSSQIGCAMGCDFCASTKAGVERSLTSGEIVEQFLWLRSTALALGRRLQTIVFMGMGEPLLNYDNVVAAIRRIAGEDLGAIGWRHVTVSTVGIIPGIDRLREENLGMQLAISLHAPDDDTRSAIIPTGKRFRVADILQAVQRYQAACGRIATIEYTLLAGVNDSDAQAELLAERLNRCIVDASPDRRARRESRMHVNLIPYNWIGPGLSGREYRRPDQDRMIRFLEILRQRDIVAHFRRTRGDEIDGACGQLAAAVREVKC